MKKTLIALLAMGSVLYAENIKWTLSSGSDGTPNNAGGKGIIFQLSDNDRLDLTSVPVQQTTPKTFTLDSISVWTRSTGATISQGCVYLTNNDNTIIAFSDLNDGAALGNNEVKFTFGAVSDIFTDKTAQEHQNQLTLTAGETYKIFYLQGNAAKVSGYEKSYVGNTLDSLFQNDINQATTQVEGVTSATNFQCGQITNDLNTVFVGSWEPMLQVAMHTVQDAPVPEPTTGTLSLLALAGLCARRRKH